MKTNLFKKFGKHLILLIFLSSNICINFTDKGLTIGMQQTFAQEGEWDTGFGWLDDFLDVYGLTSGSYMINENGNWVPVYGGFNGMNYIQDVVVYGTQPAYTPVNTGTSDLWWRDYSDPGWNYWDYGYTNWSVPSPNQLDIPQVDQTQTQWCVFAVAEALADYFGCSGNQTDFAGDYWNNCQAPPNQAAGWGYFNAHYLNNTGFNDYPPTDEEIVSALDSGWPVFARVNNSQGLAHARLITAYTLESNSSCDFYNFTIMDPDPSVGTTYNNDITSIINSLASPTEITIVKGIYCP